MTKIDHRDAIIQAHAPVVMVPNHGPLDGMAVYGHRYLAAHDGLWLDLFSPVARIRTLIAASEIPMPFGTVEPGFDFAFGRLSEHTEHLRQFAIDARAALPNEFAAWLVWDDFDQQMRYRPCTTIAATPGSVHFERPALDRNEYLAVDLHSHGTSPAFFSATDDADDAGEVKISGVLGCLDQAAPDNAFRICAMGLYFDVPVPAGVWQ